MVDYVGFLPRHFLIRVIPQRFALSTVGFESLHACSMDSGEETSWSRPCFTKPTGSYLSWFLRHPPPIHFYPFHSLSVLGLSPKHWQPNLSNPLHSLDLIPLRHPHVFFRFTRPHPRTFFQLLSLAHPEINLKGFSLLAAFSFCFVPPNAICQYRCPFQMGISAFKLLLLVFF